MMVEAGGSPIPDDAKVFEITDRSVIVLQVPDDMSTSFEESPMGVIARWCRERKINPLCIMLPDGQGLEVLDELVMAEHGWIRNDS